MTREFIESELKKVQEESNKISKEILDLINEKRPRLFQLAINEDLLIEEFYKVEKQEEPPNFNDQAWNKLYDMTDGHVQGWNMDIQYRSNIANLSGDKK